MHGSKHSFGIRAEQARGIFAGAIDIAFDAVRVLFGQRSYSNGIGADRQGPTGAASRVTSLEVHNLSGV